MQRFTEFKVLLGSLIVLAPLAVARGADKDADARKAVERGIRFLGGAKKLKQYKGVTFSEKGTYYGMGDGLPYTGQYAIEYPGKFRMEISGVFTQIVNGETGWVKTGDGVKEMTPSQLKHQQLQFHVHTVTQLFPLRNRKKYSLAHGGTAKVGETATTIVKVKSKGQADVTLYFEPKTGKLVKYAWMGPVENMPEKIAKYETFYEEYKSAGGIKYPSKFRMTRDGKKFIESTIADYKPARDIDDKLFAKPE